MMKITTVLFTMLATADAGKLRGSNYDEYLGDLEKTSDVAIPLPPPSDESASTIIAKLPEGVFDITRANDAAHLRNLGSRCNNLRNTASPEEVLGCHLLFDNTWSTHPQAMGTLKLGVNLLDSTTNGEYNADDVSILFEDHALATMIDNDCFVFNVQGDTGGNSQYEFSDTESYKRAIMTSNEIKVDNSITLFWVTVAAGYHEKSSTETTTEIDRMFAYGEKKFNRNVGTLINQCLTNPSYFEDVIVKNNLIKEEWVSKWKYVQRESDVNKLARSQEFSDVAFSGMYMPSEYHYGASVSLKVESTFEKVNSESLKQMSRTTTAGIGWKSGSGDNSVMLQAGVNNAMTEASASSSLSYESSVSTKSVGHGVSAECLESADLDCSSHLENRVAAMRSNLVKVGKPSSHKAFIDLNEIVRLYTGKDLGKKFDKALEKYFRFAQCNDVGSNRDRGFEIFDGSGKQIADGVCDRGQHMACGSSFYMTPDSEIANGNRNGIVQEAKEGMCRELTYTCAAGNRNDRYVEGQNLILDSFGNSHSCDAFEVCVEPNNKNPVHNMRSLCQATWRCRERHHPARNRNGMFHADRPNVFHFCPSNHACNPEISPLNIPFEGMCTMNLV